MPLVDIDGMRAVRMGELSAAMTRESDGTTRIRSRLPLGDYPRSMIDCLDDWAVRAPERVFLADRGPDGNWRKVTYVEAREKSRAIASYLLRQGLGEERPIVILSGNSIEHGLVALGAMRAGIPYAPVSPAYSLLSQDHAKLRHIFDLLRPGLVFAAEGAPFARALDAVMTPDMRLVVAREPVAGRDSVDFEALTSEPVSAAVEKANAAVSGDTIAKFLFTSGSTGAPKAVINTQRMLCCNQVIISAALAFLRDEPPVLVDWLPWNHTAGGNHNVGIALYNGGSLYIDDGNPTPAGIARTVRNLEDVAPTLYFNVPKGYEMLCEHLGSNERLRQNLFSRVKLLQYAGAGLSQHVWDTLETMAERTIGERVMIITGYGSTETAPFASTTTWPVGRPGEVGLPAPGLELKLVPTDGKLQLRLKGPSITPGYWRQPEKTQECFDEEGFYRIGDALKFVDPEDVNKGLLFDGRISEDFKLSTGTWVNMAAVRAAIVRAFAPYVRDAVLTGLNRNHIGALLLLDPDAARRIAPEPPGASEADIAAHPQVRSIFMERLEKLAETATGSSNFVARAVILDSPPSADRNEVTEKGSINQGAVMAARAHLVEDLYADPCPPHVLAVARKERT
jgi:feruloyl-CoA synthase